jgi:hypothetical protein
MICRRGLGIKILLGNRFYKGHRDIAGKASHQGQSRSKGLCDIPYKKIQKAHKTPPKGSFLPFCMGN